LLKKKSYQRALKEVEKDRTCICNFN